MAEGYIHGYGDSEQARLSSMQALLNESELALLRLGVGESVLEVGAGLCQMARAMATTTGRAVVAIEKDRRQIERASTQVEATAPLVDLREGDATSLPLEDEEWGSFDVAHARFLLEHVTDPQRVVDEMLRAVRVGGRVLLLDDDHELLRLSPSVPAVEAAWTTYWKCYESHGCDPLVGRRLPELLAASGARVARVDTLFYGASHGTEKFEGVVANLAGVLESAADEMDARGVLPRAAIDDAQAQLRDWSRQRGATLWYSLPFAEGIK